MKTLSRHAVKAATIEAQIKQDAIDTTLKEWKKALRTYYKTSTGGEECTRLWRELIGLGVNSEELVDIDLDVRDKYAKEDW